MRPPILGEVSRSEAPRPAGPSTKAFLAIDGLGSVEVILHGAKERGGGTGPATRLSNRCAEG